jgi:hypothetical protein
MPRAQLVGTPISDTRYCPARAVDQQVRQAMRDALHPVLSGDAQILQAWQDEHPGSPPWPIHEAQIRALQEQRLIRRRGAA